MSLTELPQRLMPEAADYVIRCLTELGASPRPSSRLWAMHRVFFDGTGNVRPMIDKTDPEFEVALESYRDVLQLAFILDTVDDAAFLEDHLKRVVYDSTLPQQDKTQSVGRNVQVELYVYAICIRAGLTPARLDEPDVQCSLNDQRFGLAVKRIKSLQKLEERVRKAAEQIERCKLPGVIVLDTTIALNPKNSRIWEVNDSLEFGAAYKLAFRSFIDSVATNLSAWVRGRGVRGIIFQDSVIHLCQRSRWSVAGLNFAFSTSLNNQRRRREFENFWHAYRRGLPHLAD